MILEELDAVAPSSLPVQALVDHLRLGGGFSDDGSEDAALEVYLRAALSAIEAQTGKALFQRRFSLVLYRWRDVERQKLPIAPVQSVESLTITDEPTGTTVVDAGAYRLIRDAHDPSIESTGGALPCIPGNGQAEIVIEAGFAPGWDGLPPDLRQAVLMLAATYFDHRHGVGEALDAIPMGLAALLAPHRPVRLGRGA